MIFKRNKITKDMILFMAITLVNEQQKTLASQKERIKKLNKSVWTLLMQYETNPQDVITALDIYTEDAED